MLSQQLQVSFCYAIQLLQISFKVPSHKHFFSSPILTDGGVYSSLDLKGPALPEIAQKNSHDVPRICISPPKCFILPVNSWVNRGAPKPSTAIFLSYLCQRKTDLFLEGFSFLKSLVCCYSGALMRQAIHSYNFIFIHLVPPKMQINRLGLQH